MALKERICRAFCEGVEVHPFKGGIGITTGFADRSGETIGFYALGPHDGFYRLVDNALTVAFLEAEGVSLDTQTRLMALHGLLVEYSAKYDDEIGELFVEGVSENDLPRAILAFSAFLLRMNDLVLITTERIEKTFKEDVKEMLRRELEGRAIIREDEPVSEQLQEIVPDMVLTATNRAPVALFIANSEARIWQAINLRLIANYETDAALSVVAMLEAENTATQRVRTQADNRLDAVPKFRNDQKAAIQRVVTEVLGRQATVH